MRAFMAHDMVSGGLVPGFVGHRAESMAERIEVPMAIDTGRIQEFLHLLRYRVIRRVLGPGIAALREEEERSVCGVLRVRPSCESIPEGFHGFRPERAPPGDPGLRPGVIDPAAIEVEGREGQ